MESDMQLFHTAGELTNAGIPQAIKALAGLLSTIHGDVTMADEDRGVHLYMACPCCLERDGDKELRSRHLAVNADKYCGTGKWKNLRGTYDMERSAMCMKTEKPFSVEDLASMPPLAARGIKASEARVTLGGNKKRLVDDGRGNMIPEGPGVCLPVIALPGSHPAVEYLVGRGYDPQRLWEQFRCSYCIEELPEDREKGRFYRKLPAGFRDTQQGRIIFYADMYGVQRGWQARIIDKIVDDREHYYWHPYENQWFLAELKDKLTGKWVLTGLFTDEFLKWEPAKYRTAPGTARNQTLMCLDAARAWNKEQGRGYDRSLVFLTEGPLSAGKLGRPAIPLLGKFLSTAQADMVVKHFKHVRYFHDNDVPGRNAAEKAQRSMAGRCEFQNVGLEDACEGKDPGDLTYEEADELTRIHKETT